MDLAGNALAQRILKLAPATVLDAVVERWPHVAHIDGLVTPTPSRPLFGPAATIRYVPRRADLYRDDRHAFASHFYRALGPQRKGKVLVLAGGHPDVSLGGGTKLSRVAHHALAGVLADGRLRDFHELKDLHFSAFCLGETARPGDGILMPVDSGVPVNVRGAAIAPGDYVYARDSMAVIIPGAHLAEVIEAAERLESLDAQWVQRIQSEDPTTVEAGGSGEK
jgi:regulator of RNase E activity RraA